MKQRLLSVLLLLALITGLTALLPLGVVAEAPATAAAQSGVIYAEDFSALKPGIYTADELTKALGWSSIGTTPKATYQITDDGKLRVYNPYASPDGSMNGQIDLFLGSFDELTTGRVVIEFERTYNEAETCMVFYSTLRIQKDGNNFVEPMSMAQGFMQNRVRYNNGWLTLVEQSRPENIAYNRYTTNYGNNPDFTIGHYVADNQPGTTVTDNRTIFKSTDTHRIVVDPVNGVDYYINGVLASSSKLDEAWRETYASACLGDELRIRVMPGIDVTYDNISVWREDAAPEALITELAPNGVAGGGWDEYIEIYNNSDRPLNIYDYAIVRANPLAGTNGKRLSVEESAAVLAGETTYTAPKNPDYTVTHTNPAYEDGWVAPGESVLLWIATNTLHNGAWSGPNGAGNGKTLDDFRAALELSEDQKAFVCYSNYNFSLNNGSGPYLYALVDKDFPAKLTEDIYKWDNLTGNFVSYVWHVNADGTGYSNEVDTDQFVKNWDSGNPSSTIEYVYAENNAARRGIAMQKGSEPNTPGRVADAQKRQVEVYVNASAGTAPLGEPLDVSALLGENDRLLFALRLDGTMVEIADGTVTPIEPVVLCKVGMQTLEGAGVRLNAPTGLRWQTALDRADLEWLLSLQERGMIASLEAGTLISPTRHVQDAGEFTAQAIERMEFSDDGYLDVAATVGEWYSETETDVVFAGSIANLLPQNYTLDFSAVGYLRLTLADGSEVTAYGGYSEELHSRNVRAVAQAALDDPNSGLTDEQKEILQGFLPAV